LASRASEDPAADAAARFRFARLGRADGFDFFGRRRGAFGGADTIHQKLAKS